MLHLLQPIWLLASAGIVVPLAIHLWNIKQGKTLKIGSVELLTRTAQQRARSLKFTEIFLLLLRCLLIILLALLLAKPYWQNTSKQKGWIVVQRKGAANAYNAHRVLIDSLSNAGYQFHFFEKGFEETNLAKITATKNDTAKTEQISYWQLLQLLDRQLLPGMPVYLFTGNEMHHFTGQRPEINIALTWKTFAGSDSAHSFIAKAYETVKDSIAVLVETSAGGGTSYHVQMLGINQPRQKDFSINVSEGRMQVTYQNGDAVNVDTSTLRIAVFSDQYVDDVRYVQAAIQSIQQVTGRKILLTIISKAPAVLSKQDWLFWLSDVKIPTGINADQIFYYATGKIMPVESWIQNNNDAKEKTELYQRIAYDQNNNDIVWRDGFGVPLLVKQNREGKIFYQSYTHLNPSWNEMVWSAGFPQVMYALINDVETSNTGNNDRRAIDQSQLKFNVTPSIKKNIAADIVDATATSRVLWCLVFILFCVERYFSFRIKKIKAGA